MVESEFDKLSLIIPYLYSKTRENLNLLERCLDSFWNNCFNKNRLNILIGVDEGDSKSINYVKKVCEDKPYKRFITIFERPQDENFLRNFYDYGSKICDSRYFWCLGADVEIKTKDYDVLLFSEIQKYYDELELATRQENSEGTLAKNLLNNPMPYIKTRDNHYTSKVSKIPCFPILSQAMRVDGYIFPEWYRSWSADWWVSHTYDYLESKLPCRVIIDLQSDDDKNIMLEHTTAHLGMIKKDAPFKKQEERTRSTKYHTPNQDAPQQLNSARSLEEKYYHRDEAKDI